MPIFICVSIFLGIDILMGKNEQRGFYELECYWTPLNLIFQDNFIECKWNKCLPCLCHT